MPDSTFGERFRFARWYQDGHGRQESDAEFAKAVGMSPASVSAWRGQDSPPPRETSQAIAKRMGVSAAWLILGEPEGQPPVVSVTFAEWLKANRRKPAVAGKESYVTRSAAKKRKGRGPDG